MGRHGPLALAEAGAGSTITQKLGAAAFIPRANKSKEGRLAKLKGVASALRPSEGARKTSKEAPQSHRLPNDAATTASQPTGSIGAGPPKTYFSQGAQGRGRAFWLDGFGRRGGHLGRRPVPGRTGPDRPRSTDRAARASRCSGGNTVWCWRGWARGGPVDHPSAVWRGQSTRPLSGCTPGGGITRPDQGAAVLPSSSRKKLGRTSRGARAASGVPAGTWAR